MSKIGNNVRLTIGREHRDAIGALFKDVLGCTPLTPPGTTDVEVFLFDGGGGIGAYYVDAEQALSATAARDGAWLEFLVDDPEATRVKLAGLGIEPFEYHDREHMYFAAPGGQVFRLGQTAKG